MTPSASMPIDVRLMDMATLALLAGLGLAAAVVACVMALRSPLLMLRDVIVGGDLAHNNAATLRANLSPKLAGSFLTLDLGQARQAVESVPWVRQAVVKREFPNRLRVSLEEHQAVAFWGEEAESRLVNSHGEVFEANTGEVEADGLPRLSGPAGQARDLLQLFRTLRPEFSLLGLELVQIDMTERGGWQALLDGGAIVQLGRGSAAEVDGRTKQFLQSLTGVSARFGRKPEALESADLRHKDGYALRLRGVATVQTVGKPAERSP